jgi:hypothetical protein
VAGYNLGSIEGLLGSQEEYGVEILDEKAPGEWKALVIGKP